MFYIFFVRKPCRKDMICKKITIKVVVELIIHYRKDILKLFVLQILQHHYRHS